MAPSKWWDPRAVRTSRWYPAYMLAVFTALAVIMHFLTGEGWKQVILTAAIAVVVVTALWLASRYPRRKS